MVVGSGTIVLFLSPSRGELNRKAGVLLNAAYIGYMAWRIA